MVLVASATIVFPGASMAADDLVADSRLALAAARIVLAEEEHKTGHGHALRRARLLLRIGQPADALSVVAKENSLAARAIAAQALLAMHEYRRAGEIIAELGEEFPNDATVRGLLTGWYFVSGDLSQVERNLNVRSDAQTLDTTDSLTLASMRQSLLDPTGALAIYRELAKQELGNEQRAAVLRGIGTAAFQLQWYEEALEALLEALKLDPLDADTIASIADTLLRLGRISEALDVLDFGVQLAPHKTRAHQLLGAGFTRMSYSELFAAFPDRFADDAGQHQLKRADALLEKRSIEEARKAYMALATEHPNWADIPVRLGSLEYSEGNFQASLRHFRHALRLCPQYGRAHAGYARSIEALQLDVNVNREADLRALETANDPAIDKVGQFVINWDSLSDRHKKQLALSIKPWSRYLPALLEGGASFYVKPLYQLLSDAPHQTSVRDQRIDYDSRLWDDVRGIGGHHTVVGIEDIETRISNKYDTALHELSHQVHAILSEQWQREIEAAYADTKRREANTGKGFLSQYASSSVWEYFAEGANALYSKKRDRFDTREVVYERLRDLDPALMSLATTIMTKADVGPSFSVAMVSAGQEKLHRGLTEEAYADFTDALKQNPESESALAMQLYTLVLMGRLEEATSLATKAAEAQPSSGSIAVYAAQVAWFTAGNVDAAIAALEQAYDSIRPEERYLVDKALGEMNLHAGNAASANSAYMRVLDRHPSDPEALGGLGAAAALAGDWQAAWPFYEKAVRERSGLLELRVNYARDLVRGGENELAAQQLATALTLGPSDPNALAIKAWLLMIEGDLKTAAVTATTAYEVGPWSTYAKSAKAATDRCVGDTAASANAAVPSLPDQIPEYVYDEDRRRFDLRNAVSAIDRDVIDRLQQLSCESPR